jgi:hypothetical protein
MVGNGTQAMIIAIIFLVAGGWIFTRQVLES